MKIIVVLCFIVSCLMVLKKSRQFSKFLKSYEDRLPLLSEPKVFASIEDYFKVLVRIIFFGWSLPVLASLSWPGLFNF